MQGKRWGQVLLLCCAVLLAESASAQTQITTAVIQGTVYDESGAVVPGATVTVKNLDTNLERTLETGGDGRFVFLQLPSGPYSLRASKQGFATIVLERMALSVGETIPLSLTMKVSPLAEEITVEAPTVDTVKTESSSTLNQLSVSNTPVLGRKFEDLFTLTPGVVIVSSPDGDQVTFAGQRGTANNISLDGGDYNNGFFGEQSGGQRPAVDITMEAVKEFQVVATGGTAEFGRTAGGVVNVITKSGTNELHGSAFHFQRHEKLTANDSQGRPLTDFAREQFGGTVGGPFVRDKAFGFFAFEQIFEKLTRPNLSEQLGTTACPQQTFTVGNAADEAVIGGNSDCQRLALLDFFRTTRTQEEGAPVTRDIQNASFLGKFDWNLTDANQLAASYTFNRSENVNQTFDVPTFGNSANGIEGTPSVIQAFNVNVFSTISPTMFNEGHFTYNRETRPREAVESNVPADTGIGFAPSFRFGNPWFLEGSIDELFWRTQARDNFSIIYGSHTIKFGGEWIHSLNNQIFRGFSQGRYLFDNVVGFLRYTADPNGPDGLPATGDEAGFGPTVRNCADGTYGDFNVPASCPTGFSPFDGPLLLYLQEASTGLVPRPLGRSSIDNEDFGFFVQDKWQVRPNFTLNFGLRWDVQYMADIVDNPSITSYRNFLSDPLFPSNGRIPDQKKMFQPRLAFAWDVLNNGKSAFRASWGIYYARHNMLSQVGSITANGVQQQSDAAFSNEFFSSTLGPMPVWPNVIPVPVAMAASPFAGVRVTAKNFNNPRIQTANVNWEQEVAPNWAYYVDFIWAKGVHLARFFNVNAGGQDFADPCANSFGVIDPSDPTGAAVCSDGNPPPTSGNTVTYPGADPFAPLGDVFTATSPGKSLYRGVTVGMRKKFSRGFQMEWNYRYAKDKDDDSNERDPFTDRSYNRFDLSRDYSLSDRDIKHSFNFFTHAELPWKLELNTRIQGRTAQPITQDPVTGEPRVLNGVDRGRNSFRKDTKFFSLDWRLARPFHWGADGRYAIVPIFEMFNTFDNKNNLDPLTTNLLFNFDGFLRQGVGDPRQVQLAVKFEF